MNHVERFKALMNFQPVDRLPILEWTRFWNLTTDRWLSEGLEYEDSLLDHFGLDPYCQMGIPSRAYPFPPAPYHGGPIINNEDDYEAIREHLYPPADEHLKIITQWSEEQSRGEIVLWISIDGYFAHPRGLFGIEPHMFAFYDQPELMHRINQDLVDHEIRVLHKIATLRSTPSFTTVMEDMSYNHGPMLSKQMFDEFLAPYYRQVVPLLKEMGTRVIVDSDGEVTEMVPWLLEVGCEGILPLERQSGVDAETLRKDFPNLLMIGHYDKMVMHRGEQALRDEFERLLPTMKAGGFIPSVDHQTPPSVSLEDYRMYVKLMKEYAVKAAQ